MSFVSSYQCAKCGKKYQNEDVPPNDGCGGRIDILVDIESLKDALDKATLANRRPGLWKYFEFMPITKRENIVSLGEGGTAFLKSKRLAEKMDLKHLYLKDETTNPSGSFKDRPICVGVSRAVEDGAETVAAASSGNAAASMSTYAARAGLSAIVFVPENAPSGKLIHLRSLGAKVFRVKKEEEGIDPTTTLLKKACDQLGWVPSPSFGPFNCFQYEGTKSIGYEISEEMNWRAPDWILFPTGSGGLMSGTMKGFDEFKEMGFIERMPRPVVVQPEGCAPIVRAFEEDQNPKNIQPWDSNETVCGGLADPFPWDGDAALRYLKEANGKAVSVPDSLVEEYLVELGRLEGIFAEPSGVAALAGLQTLMDDGVIDSSDRVVVPITGSGFKDLSTPDRLTPDVKLIDPDIGELRDALAGNW